MGGQSGSSPQNLFGPWGVDGRSRASYSLAGWYFLDSLTSYLSTQLAAAVVVFA